MFPLNDNFDATSLDSLEPVFNELLSRDVKSVSDLEVFFSAVSYTHLTLPTIVGV